MTNKYLFMADVHGNLQQCRDVADENPDAIVVQVGDLGVGFAKVTDLLSLDARVNFRFFVGNHDNRDKARGLMVGTYLGDYGVYPNPTKDNSVADFFFLSGADSIDKARRIEGLSWWPNEQLSTTQLNEAVDAWRNSSAQVLVAHDCPQSLFTGSHHTDRTPTRLALEAMVQQRPPKLMIFGHHHVGTRVVHDGVQYVGLWSKWTGDGSEAEVLPVTIENGVLRL